jgi:hypothetical protein
LVTHSDHVPEWNGLSCQLSGDRGTKETILVKDADLAHVPGIISNGHIFAYVCCQDERKISQTLEMNAIATHLASAYFLHKQEIKLLKRFGHARQKPAFLPSF